MRGKAVNLCHFGQQHRITPAYAGKRLRHVGRVVQAEDHPRVCGEKTNSPFSRVYQVGSPPRMRGKAPQRYHGQAAVGITPAYAGKSAKRLCGGCQLWDHPRVCGEKSLIPALPLHVVGSPPRMRGKVPCRSAAGRAGGITPAYAGKRLFESQHQTPKRDHPRVCGEKLQRKSQRSRKQGSPPRMRGKVCTIPCRALVEGITPAYAGKSSS